MPGGDLPLDRLPGGVATLAGEEIARTHASTLQQALQVYVPGLVISDSQGNSFQTDIQYRGFSASPVDGVPQGLAVYQNGARINEAFGDTVNLAFLPPSAIGEVAIVSNDPVFGLNALGGALTITMKDGFTYQGTELDARFGAFGRRMASLQAARRSGELAAYVALDEVAEGGYRDQGSADIKRMFADFGAKSEGNEFHLSMTAAETRLGVAGPSPVELLYQGWDKIFTKPQTTASEMEMVQATAAIAAADAIKISGLLYYRHFEQQHVDGNISSAQDCATTGGGTPGFLCLANVDGSVVTLLDQKGTPIATPPGITGELDRTSIDANTFGASVQSVDRSDVMGHANQFLVGANIVRGQVRYQSAAEIGSLGDSFTIVGTGAVVTNSDIHLVALNTTSTAYGLFLSDTFNLDSRLALTIGGRYNLAQIELADANGLSANLNGHDSFSRFNPMAGATYVLLPGISLYGGYSEGNRAPVPAELACADAQHPCLVPAFLTSDPPLKQVVSRTVEAGIRGENKGQDGDRLIWRAGLFRTVNSDDIINGYSTIIGRSFVENGGETLRQGVTAMVSYRFDPLVVYANYSYVDATFRSNLTLTSPNNPANPDPGQPFVIVVRPGDRLPGIPAQIFKFGCDYALTGEWRFGADVVAVGNQVFFGDESNQQARLPGYATVNLHTSYLPVKNIELYGMVNNIFDRHYATYGTYFNIASVPGFSDPRTIVPAQPFAAYGGVKVRF